MATHRHADKYVDVRGVTLIVACSSTIHCQHFPSGVGGVGGRVRSGIGFVTIGMVLWVGPVDSELQCAGAAAQRGISCCVPHCLRKFVDAHGIPALNRRQLLLRLRDDGPCDGCNMQRDGAVAWAKITLAARIRCGDRRVEAGVHSSAHRASPHLDRCCRAQQHGLDRRHHPRRDGRAGVR